jgi:hypothetical protein
MTDKKTLTLDVPGAVLTYDVREATDATGEPPLLMIGLPMGAEGFTTLASHFTDRSVVTYDPRGLSAAAIQGALGHRRTRPAPRAASRRPASALSQSRWHRGVRTRMRSLVSAGRASQVTLVSVKW